MLLQDFLKQALQATLTAAATAYLHDCEITWWPTTRLTSVIANKSFATKYYVMFCEGVTYLFDSLKCKSIYNFFEMDIFVFILYKALLNSHWIVGIKVALSLQIVVSVSISKFSTV